MFDVEGFILVGGASRRMGTDKAELLFNGEASVEIIAAELAKIASPVALVGARRHYRRLELLNVPDIHLSWGALGGIHAALATCEKTWAAIVACDLPFVTAELLERLKDFIDESTDAVVPIQADGRPQPLCAFYRRETCLPKAEETIAADEHTPRAMLARIRTRWVEFAEVADLPEANNFFLNVNTPADFELAKKLMTRKSRA